MQRWTVARARWRLDVLDYWSVVCQQDTLTRIVVFVQRLAGLDDVYYGLKMVRKIHFIDQNSVRSPDRDKFGMRHGTMIRLKVTENDSAVQHDRDYVSKYANRLLNTTNRYTTTGPLRQAVLLYNYTHKKTKFRRWTVSDDMCGMDHWSFWSWFDVNLSAFDKDMHEQRVFHFRSQWPRPLISYFLP